MQELTLEQTENVGGGLPGLLGYFAFVAIGYLGALAGWWEFGYQQP